MVGLADLSVTVCKTNAKIIIKKGWNLWKASIFPNPQVSYFHFNSWDTLL